MTMAVRGRPSQRSEAMDRALDFMRLHPECTTREVAEKFGVDLKFFRTHVYHLKFAYRREVYRGRQVEGRGRGQLAPVDYSDAPAFRKPSDEEQALQAEREQALAHERGTAPAEVRAKRQLAERFELLARLWGDWIKK